MPRLAPCRPGHFVRLFDGQPDGLAAGFGLDDESFELVEPLARFQELAYNLVAAYENAACGVGGGVLASLR